MPEVKMPRTKDNNDDRRNEFVRVAEDLFKKNGIVDTTINSIVKEMDVAKGLFYYYFNSKDDVIDAISEKYNEVFRTSMKQSMDELDFPTRLDRFVENTVDAFKQLKDKLEGADGADLSALSLRSMDEAKEQAGDTLKDLLEEGNDLHHLHVENTEYLADMIVGGITNLVEKGEATPEEMKKLIIGLIEKTGKD